MSKILDNNSFFSQFSLFIAFQKRQPTHFPHTFRPVVGIRLERGKLDQKCPFDRKKFLQKFTLNIQTRLSHLPEQLSLLFEMLQTQNSD
jgi:hypothetical protein